MNYKGESIEENSEKNDLNYLRKVKEILQEQIVLNTLDDEAKAQSDEDEVDEFLKKTKLDNFVNAKVKHNKNINSDSNEIDICQIPRNQRKMSNENFDLIYTALKKSFLFNIIPNENLADLINFFDQKTYKKGDIVCLQNEIGKEMFIVSKGKYDCYVLDNKKEVHNEIYNPKIIPHDAENSTIEKDKPLPKTLSEIPNKQDLLHIKNYSQGGLFGELALMYNTYILTTIVCK
jgi:phage pi2 protein 07